MRKYMLSLWLSWVLELPESGAKRGATIAQIKEAVNIEEAEPWVLVWVLNQARPKA